MRENAGFDKAWTQIGSSRTAAMTLVQSRKTHFFALQSTPFASMSLIAVGRA